MATKVHHLIQPFPGTKDLYTLLDVIRNKDQLESALSSIEAARKQANDTIEKIAPATEIDSLRNEAGRLHSLAKQALEDANAKAEKIVNDANLKALALQSESDRRNNELDQRRKDFEDYQSVRASALNTIEADLKKKETNLSEREKLASDTLTKAQAVRAEYEEKMTRFNRMSAELK